MMKKFSPKEATLLKITMNVLQNRPWEFGVVLEDGRWLSVKELQKVLSEEGIKWPGTKGLVRFFELYRPEGIEVKDGKIRAIPSEAMDCVHARESYPPDTLYLGVKSSAIEHIRAHGIDCKRNKIVLSSSRELAQRIIKRKTGKFIVIKINSRAAQDHGIRFESLGGQLYSCTFLRPRWMDLPKKKEEEEQEKTDETKRRASKRKKVKNKQEAPLLPGSFPLGLDPSEVHYLEQKAKGRRKQPDRRRKKEKRLRAPKS